MGKFILCILSLLLISCDNNVLTPDTGYLDLHMSGNQDENGFYTFDYPDLQSNSYTAVYYETLPYTRVFWTSVDSFTVYHWGEEITEPIINFSTFSNGDGTGQQMIYLYPDFIGDTLMVYGCTENDACSSLNFIVY
jgi:hypothetical protein